jgi:CubicO group peptidase (beta-lactamase class C family)
MLLLQQDGLLNVNDKVDEYIKSNKNNDFSNITILDLINHKAGLKHMPKMIHKKWTKASDVVNSFIDEKLFEKTKGDYHYSNVGFLILGKIMEVVTGYTYLEIYKKYIFDKLDMKNTGIGNTNIKLYTNKGNLTKDEYLERYFASTGGGLYSCAHDLILFGKNCFNLLNKKSIEIIKKITKIFKAIENKNMHIILNFNGLMWGGKSHLNVGYEYNDGRFESYAVYVKLETIKGY